MSETSPILSSNPESVSELFARDPDEWDDARMERMIAEMRKLRANIGENPRASAKPKAAKISTAQGAADLLKDLGL